MTTYDAQTALNAIHHRQEQTLDAYVRHAHSRPYLILAALGLFAACSSFDLPNPWKTAAVLTGNVLTLGGLFMQRRRAPVRRKIVGSEALFYTAIGVLLLVLFWTLAIGAYFLGLPARHTLAAAVTALTATAASYALRPVVGNFIRRNGHA
ncbi:MULTISPECIES: hypothetical protein [unclassified Streptomyces]|uniref:hypothetical protein n=1 Tax=unclassified Streptomyces TaxID=2593676 RepID=UPI002E2CE7E2|nr:hypothetical protein [Streptomyces sp. NBC_01439]